MTQKELKIAKESWRAGFLLSGEGWNGEYPFNDGAGGNEENEKKLQQSLNQFLKQTYGISTNKKSAKNIRRGRKIAR